MSQKADVERWDRWARTYDRGWRARLFLRPLYRRLLELAAPGPRERVLDVGAGTGSVVASMLARGAHAFGADPSAGMVRAATSKAGPRFVVAAAEALPFPSGAFDLAITSMSMHHWRSAERGIAEMARVLRPGGRALLADLEGRGFFRLSNALARLRPRPHAPRYLRREEVASALVSAGLALGRQVVRRRRVLLTLARRP